MSITQSLERAQQLLKQLSVTVQAPEQALIAQIDNELRQIYQYLDSSRTVRDDPVQHAVLDAASGCYRIDNDPAFYCPHCYKRDQYRSATQRINSKLRVCPRCRSSLKPQV